MSEPASITCPQCGNTSYDPDDVAEGYCGLCHIVIRDLPEGLEYLHQTVAALRPILDALTLPPIMLGETLPPGLREVLYEGDGISLRRGAQFYRPNGEPIDLPSPEAWGLIAEIRATEAPEITADLRTKRGVAVQVSTGYLGVDLSLGGPVPHPWETIVAIGDPAFLLEPHRYTTMAAAHSGHEQIVAALGKAISRGWPAPRKATS